MQSRVINTIGANVGDVVKIQLSFGSLSAGAAILYLLPVIGMLCGAFVEPWLTEFLNISEMLGSILGAMCGLVFGFIIVILVDHSRGMRRRFTPVITDIVTPYIGMSVTNKAYCRSC
jgi:sigma-E factor negative regulatory protein RseC